MQETKAQVAILYPGEMGAALAAVLSARGYRVVTTLAHRGDATARRCIAANVHVLQSLGEVVRQSHIVISLVPPAAAEETSQAFCGLAHLAPPAALYVDANSIGPDLARGIGERIARTGHAFVDAAINGLAKNLTTTGTLFLSGERTTDIANLFGDSVRTQILGDQPGQASSMKMLLSGLSKGICALYAELALVARAQGMLPDFAQSAAQIYPGVSALIDRMLPTYAQHAARRATEMREVEQTAQSAGVDPCVLTAVRQFHDLLAAAPLDHKQHKTVESIVEQLSVLMSSSSAI